jgi:hypothetical protein
MHLFWEVDNSLQKTGIETMNSRVFLCNQEQFYSHTEKLLRQNCICTPCQAPIEIRE